MVGSVFDCPQCSPGLGRFRLGYNLAYGYFSCWSCGRLRAGDVLAELTGLPMRQALALARDVAPENPREEIRPSGKLRIPSGVGALKKAHRSYLKRRGFDPDYLEEVWGVRGIGQAPRLAWRLWLPITFNGDIVSWTTRALNDEDGAKYISAAPEEEAIPARQLLFGEDHCRHGIALVEGPLDAISIGPGGAATLGLQYRQAQVRRAAKFPVRVVVPDNEPAARRRFRRLARDLEPFPGETYIAYLDSKDPGEATRRELEKLRALIR